MWITRSRVLMLLAWLALPAAVLAQFGHPLDGQWSGQWGPNDKPNRLLLDLDWDGKTITGEINPGPTAAIIKSVTIDYSDRASWVVKLEAEGRDASGKVVPITVDGRLENIGAYRRYLRGTWTQGSQKGAFIISRN